MSVLGFRLWQVFSPSMGLLYMIPLRAMRTFQDIKGQNLIKGLPNACQCPTVKSVLHSNITQTGFKHLMMKFPFVEIQSALHLYFSFLAKTVVIKRLFFPQLSDSGNSVLPLCYHPWGTH